MTAALGTPLRYLALGDSYTIGEGVALSQRWPAQLVDGLRAHGWNVAPPQIIASTGWTIDELQAGIDTAAPHGPFDLVSLLIGVNNQYRGRSLDEYRSQFDNVLQRAIAFAGGHAARVFVLSMPDWGLTPFARAQSADEALIAAQIDAFNSVAADRCAERAVRFVDITATSRDGGDAADMLVDDGLHPSGAMYARWATLALPAARDALGAVRTVDTIARTAAVPVRTMHATLPGSDVASETGSRRYSADVDRATLGRRNTHDFGTTAKSSTVACASSHCKTANRA
ncbi:Hypothetical Protein PD5205_00642 [Xanthomonas fragariae]|uniref:GDSL-like Lipase/Acylhydrolase n=1 Tax=Xanthomonas fragariae TaxID=48664 RepID=A0A1Y6HB51_9XANT|nr:hypothetical protein O1K_06217 [Xanthomonas fragariae LMG 25863]SMR00587.1 GDSL-like Lipase/Acylhydrolase [Xanthomonas fragariae]SMR01962.1 Hypothetical Protein PD5205_00642 [Xanthomonas fragariae]